MNFGSNNSHLWVGTLPNYLPVELPKLPNAEVIGSESRKDRYFDSFLIHLDTHDSAEQVQAFYQAQLTSRGWTQAKVQKPRQIPRAIKPQVDEAPQKFLHFCNLAKEVALSVMTNSTVNSGTEVRLSLEPRKSSRFCQTKKEQDHLAEEMSNQMLTQLKTQYEKRLKLAQIAAPPGSKVFPLSGGLFGDALVRTSLEPQLLTEHYASQMRLAGWSYRNGGKDRNFFWSTWVTVDAQGNKLIALVSLVVDSGLPEVDLFQDENAEAPDSFPMYLASLSAALPIQKSRQYLVSLTVFELNDEESKPSSQNGLRYPSQSRKDILNGDSNKISQTLALRLLGEGFKGKLFANQLPPHLPTPFPLPPTATLIGSWVDDEEEVVLYFDVSQPAQAIHQFYRAQSKALEWIDFVEEHSQLSQIGFLPTKDDYQLWTSAADGLQYVFLCDRKRDVEIVLQTWEQSPTSTEFRVDLRPGSDNCEESDKESEELSEMQVSIEKYTNQVPIPVLNPPANAQVSQRSESLDKKFYFQQASIISQTLTSNALALHYEKQMQEKGWLPQARYATELIYLSLWQLTDKKGNQWYGLLKFVRSQPSSNSYSADLTLLKSQNSAK